MIKKKKPPRAKSKDHSCESHKKPGLVENLLKVLESKGFRRSKKREVVLRYLAQVSRPVSVEDILVGLSRPKIDRVSLYRMLSAFQAEELLFAHDFGDRIKRFELSGNGHHHHHIICRKCRRVDRLPDCSFGDLQSSPRQYGYTALSHSLEFFGVCAICTQV